MMMKSTPQPSGKSAAAGDAEQAAADHRNANVLIALRQYQAANGIGDRMKDLGALARRMGTSETYLYRYLRNEFLGDQAKFEQRIQSFLSGDQVERVELTQEVVGKDFCVGGVSAFLRHVREHGYIGIGYGSAGRGKTIACRLYAAQNAGTCIYLHMSIWRAGRHDLARSIARAMQLQRVPKGTSIDDHLVHNLTGSHRLIIIDNAHRLTESARRWLADFWEETRCAIALVGNPEIEQQWERNDQHGSRVGLHRDVTADLVKSTAKATAAHLLRLHLPEACDAPTVLHEATEAVKEFGSCRAVVMRAVLASKMLSGGQVSNAAEAWNLAKTQLIKQDKKPAPSKTQLTAA